MASIYVEHPRSLAVLFADIESHALATDTAFIGTAGSVLERTNASGFRFYAHQFYGGDGRKKERYVAGPTGDADADRAADELRTRIREVKGIVPSLRLLGREGFQLVDAKTYATIASLHNHGVFAAGGVLVGSHAFGVILNRLGVRAATYATEDIDIARPGALAFEEAPALDFLAMLQTSGIEFVEVPPLDRREPSTSFKQRGRAPFHVDLLAPSPDETFPIVAVPELGAHATALPYLRYLLGESQMTAVIAREGCCAVRVPLPERFAVHKLLVSQLRVGRGAKSGKDVDQACVIAAALGDLHPGALEAAVAALPRSARRRYRAALILVQRRLAAAHPRAWAELSGAAAAG